MAKLLKKIKINVLFVGSLILTLGLAGLMWSATCTKSSELYLRGYNSDEIANGTYFLGAIGAIVVSATVQILIKIRKEDLAQLEKELSENKEGNH